MEIALVLESEDSSQTPAPVGSSIHVSDSVPLGGWAFSLTVEILILTPSTSLSWYKGQMGIVENEVLQKLKCYFYWRKEYEDLTGY